MGLLKSFDSSGELEKIYNEKILGQKVKTISAEEEIHCEDSQQFLKKFYEKSEKTVKMNSIGRIRVPQREDENYNTNTSTTSISQSNFNSNQISTSTTNQMNLSQSRINTTTQNQSSSTNPASTTMTSSSNYENLKEKLNRMRIQSKGTNNTQPPQQQ